LPTGRKVAVFVGPGNNGGDGLVIARHLYQRGALPIVFLLAHPEEMKGDAATNLEIVRNLAIDIRLVTNTEDLASATHDFAEIWLIVDAMFGTGLSRALAGHYEAAVSLIDGFSGPVVAVDVPSGLNSDSGQTTGPCVRADLTVTLGVGKPGLLITTGSGFAGRIEVEDIGIPPEAVKAANIKMTLLEAAVVRKLLPTRQPAGHKGTFGHLLVVAGSAGKTGAALLCGHAALRAGCGLVTLAALPAFAQIFAAIPEIMTEPLADSGNPWFASSHFVEILSALQKKQVLAIGPGIGTRATTGDLVIRLYQESKVPMVVDADALNILAAQPEVLRNPPAPRILTPHPGEMARLIGRSTLKVQADRLAIASTFACDNQVIVVLKGAGSVIAGPDGSLALNPTGNCGMATAGMGDVLTGIIAGFIAQGLQPWPAACLAVYIHGLAGDRLAANLGIQMGFTASELANEIPKACSQLGNSDPK